MSTGNEAGLYSSTKSFEKSVTASASHSLMRTPLAAAFAASTFAEPRVGTHRSHEPSVLRPIEKFASCRPHATLSAMPPPWAGDFVSTRLSPLSLSENPVFGAGTAALSFA